MLPDIQPGNTKILYFFNCLLDGMHTNLGQSLYTGSQHFSGSKEQLEINQIVPLRLRKL